MNDSSNNNDSNSNNNDDNQVSNNEIIINDVLIAPSTTVTASTPKAMINNRKTFRLKSIESRRSVKIVLHNQSNRKIEVIWIDYDGMERKFSKLMPKSKFVIDSFVTHPWIFRDNERRNLAIFDALIANRLDLIAFHKWDKYSEQKRFQIADRILLPKQHEHGLEFLLIFIKNGVYSLQELCIFTLIDQIKISQSSMTATNSTSNSQIIQLPSYMMDYLPKHLSECLSNHLNYGQNLSEFLSTD